MDSTYSSTLNSPVLRKFGRYELRQLLGKSVATMCWLVFDPREGRELMLTLPRVQPIGPQAQERWADMVGKAARLDHPNLAAPVEIGVQDQWPFVAVARANAFTLAEWFAAHPSRSPAEMVDVMIQAAQGLAFAHEAGVAHLDVQPHSLLIDEEDRVRWMALAVAGAPKASATTGPDAQQRGVGLNPLQVQREAAERDLLACGLLMHLWLCGRPALDEPDIARVIARIPPHGAEIIRLPWGTSLPIPDALRAIVNRSTAHQERQRYHSTRTLQRALEGWRHAQIEGTGGALGLLLDRLHSVGHLPAMPGLAGRVAAMTSLEGQHADEMTEQVLQDMGLSLELIRLSNSAQMRGTALADNGPVLAIRRSIALLGVDGVRSAANSLRLWPGPLQAADAVMMGSVINQVRLAGFAAQALRPPGYDPEVVYLIVVLQNLGRLLVQYHFPDEAAQIRQLMEAAPPPANAEPGTPDLPGMTEEAAANAVLGVDLDTLRAAVARHWSLGEEVLLMTRRLAGGKSPRTPGNDVEMLRATASAANELADAVKLKPPQRAVAAVAQVAVRYAKILKISDRDVREALHGARVALRNGSPLAVSPSTPTAAVPAAASPGDGAATTPAARAVPEH